LVHSGRGDKYTKKNGGVNISAPLGKIAKRNLGGTKISTIGDP